MEGKGACRDSRRDRSGSEATREEQVAILELADAVKGRLDAELRPDGYNGGFNAGAAAGQTVPHLHLHLIPRFQGDGDDPTGGVRFVIPARANYRNPGFIPGLGGASILTESAVLAGEQ